MRISDWSSDVCSSDLFGEGGGDQHLPGLELARFELLVGVDDVDVAARPALVADIIGEGFRQRDFGLGERLGIAAARLGDRLDEIGRASCRERVCQYV